MKYLSFPFTSFLLFFLYLSCGLTSQLTFISYGSVLCTGNITTNVVITLEECGQWPGESTNTSIPFTVQRTTYGLGSDLITVCFGTCETVSTSSCKQVMGYPNWCLGPIIKNGLITNQYPFDIGAPSWKYFMGNAISGAEKIFLSYSLIILLFLS